MLVYAQLNCFFFNYQGLNGDLGAREVLIGELRVAAEPLRESCAAEVRERVDAAVNEAVQAWENTRAELDSLCTRYQHACMLWQQYRDSSAAVKAWVDTQMNSVVNLPPEEAVKQVKVSNAKLFAHDTKQMRQILIVKMIHLRKPYTVHYYIRFWLRKRETHERTC